MWNSLRRKARLACELSLADWLSLIEAWSVLVVFYFVVRWMSYERLSAENDSVFGNPSSLIEAHRLHRLVGWAAQIHLLPMTCLVQSLTLRWMLARRGISSRLKIGVQHSHKFRAHAWLEVEGENVGELEDVGGIFRILRGTSPPSTS